MKQYAIAVPGSVVTQKTAAAYIARLIGYFMNDSSLAMSNVITDAEERIVNAGFMTWDEIEQIEIRAMA